MTEIDLPRDRLPVEILDPIPTDGRSESPTLVARRLEVPVPTSLRASMRGPDHNASNLPNDSLPMVHYPPNLAYSQAPRFEQLLSFYLVVLIDLSLEWTVASS